MLADEGRRISVLTAPSRSPHRTECAEGRELRAKPSQVRAAKHEPSSLRVCRSERSAGLRSLHSSFRLRLGAGWVAVGLFRLKDSSSRCPERQRNYFRNQFHRTPTQKAQPAASTLNSISAKHRAPPSPVIAPARRFSKNCSGRTNSDALNLLPHRYPITILCIVAQPPIVQAALPVNRLERFSIKRNRYENATAPGGVTVLRAGPEAYRHPELAQGLD